MSSIIDEALGSLTRTWIEATFGPGTWSGPKFMAKDPSGVALVIFETGRYSRGASESGTIVDLVAKRDKLTKDEAAAKILGRDLAGHKAARKGKIKAKYPVPANWTDSVRKAVSGAEAKAAHGNVLKVVTYLRTDKTPSFCVARFSNGEQIKAVPYFYGEDDEWHEGYPTDVMRPLYALPHIASAPTSVPVLVVSTEWAAKEPLDGYVVTTWAGDHKDVAKTDWSPLDGRQVILWLTPAEVKAVQNRLPHAAALDLTGKPEGWDRIDAEAVGIAVQEFIETCPRIGGDKPEGARVDDGLPFRCLGYDKAGYYFLPKKTRVVHTISVGSFKNAQMLELAPLSWWGSMPTGQVLVTEQGALKQAIVQDMLINLQHKVGWFDPAMVRGAGVWRDAGGLVLNDGSQIVTMDRRALSYDEFPSRFCYVPSQVGFGDMHGTQSDDDEGRDLERLFAVQEFENRSQAVLLMGWCLTACFGAILDWRPHGWLTGRSGTGKSWLWENVVEPLVGPFAHTGSAKDTEAGVRWSLDQDARPALFAEMEPKNEASRARIAGILELARNSSDDTSGRINISQAGGGTKSFHLRSMFLFNSVQIPSEDRATSGRIVRFELRAGIDMAIKKRESDKIISTGLLDDPGRFRRRIFHALPRIVADVVWLKSQYLGVFGRMRGIAQVAPLIAAAWAVQSSESVQTAGKWLEDIIAQASTESSVQEDDEDVFMRTLLGAVLKTDENKGRSVAELLLAASADDTAAAHGILERNGLKLQRTHKADPWTLCIATKSAAIEAIFKGTPYASGYGGLIRRHQLFIGEDGGQGGRGAQRVFAGVKVRCQVASWDAFREMYLERDDAAPLFDEYQDAPDGEEPPF